MNKKKEKMQNMYVLKNKEIGMIARGDNYNNCTHQRPNARL